MTGPAAGMRPLSAEERDPEHALLESIHGLTQSILRQLRPALEAQGLSMERFWVLHLVVSLPRPTLSSVARHLSVSSPSACTAVDGLVRAGLVHRQRSQRDRRLVELVPTVRGRQAEAAVWRAIRRALKGATARLSPAEVETTSRTIAAVAASLAPPPDAATGEAA